MVVVVVAAAVVVVGSVLILAIDDPNDSCAVARHCCPHESLSHILDTSNPPRLNEDVLRTPGFHRGGSIPERFPMS